MRLKRKRYRNKKKKEREGWKLKIVGSIGARWRKRQEAYIEAEKKEGDTQLEDQLLNDEVDEKSSQKCEYHIDSSPELYQKLANGSTEKTSCEALLLPSIPNESVINTSKDTEQLAGVDRVYFSSSIQLEREKTRKALEPLEQVKHYRNLAERLRSEKRDVVCSMNKKVEVVRDFWRNKILEGSTRAGKIVKSSIDSRRI